MISTADGAPEQSLAVLSRTPVDAGRGSTYLKQEEYPYRKQTDG